LPTALFITRDWCLIHKRKAWGNQALRYAVTCLSKLGKQTAEKFLRGLAVRALKKRSPWLKTSIYHPTYLSYEFYERGVFKAFFHPWAQPKFGSEFFHSLAIFARWQEFLSLAVLTLTIRHLLTFRIVITFLFKIQEATKLQVGAPEYGRYI